MAAVNYVGIDLGTTNSVISSYDGERVHLYKSPEQQDVTPSAIFVDKRGNRYLGLRAYNNAARNPDNAALNFKRLMGTSTPILLAAVNLTMTPEECSAEILKLLYGYLPAAIRADQDTGVVIGVPAAFNQMQKDATMTAAQAAGIGRAALMQEPVAAVMSVMRAEPRDGAFMVYDLGGGTLDVAIAESIGGRVSLLAHGGIAMCGGRDFDRAMFDQIVKPWLLARFKLPFELAANPQYRPLVRMATWAAENAKIALSQRDQATISLSETDLAARDTAGEEIFVDIAIDRTALDRLIASQVDASIAAAREILASSGLNPANVERIVFVGGPTQYPPLRAKVSAALGIAVSTDVNPMTAVAEGAAVFAESIDWSTASHGRKTSRGVIGTGGTHAITFNFIARTPDTKARIVADMGGDVAAGYAFQIDSLDSGWTSGRMPLRDGASVDLVLAKPADNSFKVFVFDSNGSPLTLPQDRITISRTAAHIDAIPASHSIGIEVLDRPNGKPVLDFLVRSGDRLPAKGKREYKAAESLRSGASGCIRIRLWEGDIADPVQDNLPIGTLKINGSDIEEGAIAAGEKLIVEYEIFDSGTIDLKVSVPAIGALFRSGRNFYARQEAQIDFTKAAKLIADMCSLTRSRIDQMLSKINDIRLDQARDKLDAMPSGEFGQIDAESAKKILDELQAIRRLLAQVRQDHLAAMRSVELANLTHHFEKTVRTLARPSEVSAFENLAKTAQRAIDRNTGDFESHVDAMRARIHEILWRQDWYVIDRFNWLVKSSYLFPDAEEHAKLAALAADAMHANDFEKFRGLVGQFDAKRLGLPSDEDLAGTVNLLRG
ncbi:MAG TPA: Hsp70 family protein [Steroidobacteraceae bacterium]